MAIAFKCKCGRSMKVRNDNAGKKVRCPDCGKGVRIPVLDPTTEDEIKALKSWAKHTEKSQRESGRPTPPPENKESYSTPSTLEKTPPPKNKLRKKSATMHSSDSTSPLVPVAILGTVGVLAFLVWLIWLR